MWITLNLTVDPDVAFCAMILLTLAGLLYSIKNIKSK